MSDTNYKHGEFNRDRLVGKTGEILQVDGDWHLEDHINDAGPVILHAKCGTYLIDLNRKYPLCRKCGATIPPSMISGFTMLNWDKADDVEYFVQEKSEINNFICKGHLQLELRKLPPGNVTEKYIAELLTKEKL